LYIHANRHHSSINTYDNIYAFNRPNNLYAGGMMHVARY
jgi:hypothetical protein